MNIKKFMFVIFVIRTQILDTLQSHALLRFSDFEALPDIASSNHQVFIAYVLDKAFISHRIRIFMHMFNKLKLTLTDKLNIIYVMLFTAEMDT